MIIIIIYYWANKDCQGGCCGPSAIMIVIIKLVIAIFEQNSARLREEIMKVEVGKV